MTTKARATTPEPDPTSDGTGAAAPKGPTDPKLTTYEAEVTPTGADQWLVAVVANVPGDEARTVVESQIVDGGSGEAQRIAVDMVKRLVAIRDAVPFTITEADL